MASGSRIKGLTIQIDGDTTGLNQALKKTNSTINSTQRELKDVERLLKLDPTNTELLRQKQRLLAEQISTTSDKLKTLKEAQKQAQDQLERGEISQKQYDALEREVAETEQELRKLEDAADDTQKELDQLGDEAEEAAGDTDKLSISLKDMIKNAAVNLAVDAIREIGREAIEAAKYVVEVGSNFEAEMDKVAAISGATGSELDALSEKAKQMGATTKFSASESAEAFEYMAMAGWKTDEMLKGIDGVMALAAASGEDLATTSDIVTDALTAFGESADQSGRLADIMAAASSNANTNVAMMGETFKYAAPVAGSLGASMEDTAIAVGLMANSGIKASQAGTALRSGLTNLVKPTKQMKEYMEKYNVAVVENEDGSVNLRDTMIDLREKMGGLTETEQAAAAGAIFGKNAMSGWLAIINSSDEDFDQLCTAIDNSNGAAQGMADTMQNNLSGSLTIFKSALEGLGIAMYEKVAGPMTGAVESATKFISGLTEAISGSKSYIDDFYDSVKDANEETAKSIENAKKTVDDAKSKVTLLTGYEQEFTTIIGKCSQFKQSLDGLGGKSKQVGYLKKSFDETTGAIKETYTITDEFTKSKITDMVSELSGTVDGLAEAWNAETGELTASKEQLEEWFGVAKEVAMYEALEDSIKELTTAYGEAGIAQIKAKSGYDAAKEALDAFYVQYQLVVAFRG